MLEEANGRISFFFFFWDFVYVVFPFKVGGEKNAKIWVVANIFQEGVVKLIIIAWVVLDTKNITLGQLVAFKRKVRPLFEFFQILLQYEMILESAHFSVEQAVVGKEVNLWDDTARQIVDMTQE